jgi:putative peptidoglycan lipid II flippase
MSQMLKSSGAMGAATLSSRVLGLVREQVYARFMGDTPVASAFILAFQVPNLFRRLLGEGALTAAFIPIFKEKEKAAGEVEMWRAANAVVSGLVVAVAMVVGLLMLGIAAVLGLASLHLGHGGLAVFPPLILSPNTRLMLQLLGLMAPYLFLACLTALCMGILNARNHFFIPAFGATLLNVVMIASVFLLAPRFGTTLETQIFALGVGVLVAGVAQLAFQLPTLWAEGYRARWVTPWHDPTVREVVRKMLPGTIGVAAFPINVLLIQCLSWWVDKTIVASFNYAVRLMEFPQGVVGISLATYLLPTLSGLAAQKKYLEYRKTLTDGLGYLIFVNLLAAVLLLVLAEPIVRLLFERGLFTSASTHRASLAVTFLAPGLVAFSTVNILARAFYALGDTQTPMKVSLACLVLNLVVAALLVVPLRQAGLGLANTISAGVNVWLLLRALRLKMPNFDLAPLGRLLATMLAITVLAGLTAWSAHYFCNRGWGHATLLRKAGEVFVPMALATAVYWGLALWARVPQAHEFGELVLGRFRKRAGDPGQN